MKPGDAEDLLSLMKAKTQAEQYAYEGLKRQHAIVRERSAQLRKEATTPPTTEPGEFSADFYKQDAARVAHLLAQAKRFQQQAEELEGELTVKRQRLEKALQRELALAKLIEAFQIKARKDFNKNEESQHELVRTVRKLQQEVS